MKTLQEIRAELAGRPQPTLKSVCEQIKGMQAARDSLNTPKQTVKEKGKMIVRQMIKAVTKALESGNMPKIY